MKEIAKFFLALCCIAAIAISCVVIFISSQQPSNSIKIFGIEPKKALSEDAIAIEETKPTSVTDRKYTPLTQQGMDDFCKRNGIKRIVITPEAKILTPEEQLEENTKNIAKLTNQNKRGSFLK